MMRFFEEGGIGMYPVLVFGLVSLFSSARYAWDLERVRLRFSVVMNVLVAISALHAMLLDVAAVFSFVQELAEKNSPELTRVVFIGLMESSRPGAFAGIFMVLSLTLIAVGIHRDGQRELRQA